MNGMIQYFDASGRPTIEGLKYFAARERAETEAREKLKAIAAIVAPTGGATIDTQSRAAIVAIIGAAG